MGEKFIIFDRDGVINVEKSYLYRIEDFNYEEGVIESLRRLSGAGYRFIIITNQSGIARGYYTEEDYLKLEKFIEEDMLDKGIRIERTYFCPHHPEGKGIYRKDCMCRKPSEGNFLKAIKDFGIDPGKSYMIGDRVTDLIPAEKLGFRIVLIRTGYGNENIGSLKEHGLKPIIVNNMKDFADKVLKNH